MAPDFSQSSRDHLNFWPIGSEPRDWEFRIRNWYGYRGLSGLFLFKWGNKCTRFAVEPAVLQGKKTSPQQPSQECFSCSIFMLSARGLFSSFEKNCTISHIPGSIYPRYCKLSCSKTCRWFYSLIDFTPWTNLSTFILRGQIRKESWVRDLEHSLKRSKAALVHLVCLVISLGVTNVICTSTALCQVPKPHFPDDSSEKFLTRSNSTLGPKDHNHLV